MTVLTGLTTFTAGTPAVASQVNSNFSAVKTYVDALSAGTNIDNGTLGISKLSSAATGILSPIGSIVQYVGAAAPNDSWKICNGQTLVIASYPDLYNLLTASGTVFPWGANPSAGNFVVPNFSGRVPVAKSVDAEFNELGETGGAKTHLLTSAESGLVGHNHTVPTAFINVQTGGSTIFPVDPSGLGVAYSATAVAGANASSAHNNLQPYIVVNYIIKVL